MATNKNKILLYLYASIILYYILQKTDNHQEPVNTTKDKGIQNSTLHFKATFCLLFLNSIKRNKQKFFLLSLPSSFIFLFKLSPLFFSIVIAAEKVTNETNQKYQINTMIYHQSTHSNQFPNPSSM